MLSRTANDVYWMSRHIERAENIARMLDVTYRMSLLPYRILEPGEKWAEPWALPLIINGLAKSYYQRYSDLQAEHVLHFMTLDASNPSSIYSSLQTARENARAQRGAVTIEMWESLNDTWLAMRNKTFTDISVGGVSPFFDWVKDRSHLFRGITFGTMIRDEAFSFIARRSWARRQRRRILGVRHHTLLPSAHDVGGAVDYYSGRHCCARCRRSASTTRSATSYAVPRGRDPVLREVPRSLRAMHERDLRDPQGLSDEDRLEPERLAGEIHALIHSGKTEKIFEAGLHEWLLGFLEKIGALNAEVNKHFLVPSYQ
jgi:uncharacterized alpha-E superfamily protein